MKSRSPPAESICEICKTRNGICWSQGGRSGDQTLIRKLKIEDGDDQIQMVWWSALKYTSDLYCWHLELDKYDNVSNSSGHHWGEKPSLDFKEPESSQRSDTFNFLKEKKLFLGIQYNTIQCMLYQAITYNTKPEEVVWPPPSSSPPQSPAIPSWSTCWSLLHSCGNWPDKI